MSMTYYIFKVSTCFFKFIYNLDYYTNFTSNFNNFIYPIINFKRINKYILHNNDNNKIKTTFIYFRNLSPLRKETQSKQQIYNINENNINNSWEIYEKETKNKPKIGDFIEVHYSVPYEKLNKSNDKHIIHKEYTISYIYPSNIQFPPYDLKFLRDYYNLNNYKNGVLCATYNDKDVTTIITKLAGPLGNFYSDLPPIYGIKITRDIFDDTFHNDTTDLLITDNNGYTFNFKPNSIIKI